MRKASCILMRFGLSAKVPTYPSSSSMAEGEILDHINQNPVSDTGVEVQANTNLFRSRFLGSRNNCLISSLNKIHGRNHSGLQVVALK